MCAQKSLLLSDHKKNPNLSSSDPQQQEAAVLIQSEYRRHRASKEADELRDEQAAIQIQAAYRGYRDRKCLELSVTQSDGFQQDTEQEEQQPQSSPSAPVTSSKPATSESKEDSHQSDLIAQGFTSSDEPQTTPALESSVTQSHQTDQEPITDSESYTQSTKTPTARPTEESDEEQARAAVIIQAQYRGYRDRKQYCVTVITQEQTSSEPISVEQTSSDGEKIVVTVSKTIEEVVDDSESDPVQREATPIEHTFVVKELATTEEEEAVDTTSSLTAELDPAEQPEIQRQQESDESSVTPVEENVREASPFEEAQPSEEFETTIETEIAKETETPAATEVSPNE